MTSKITDLVEQSALDQVDLLISKLEKASALSDSPIAKLDAISRFLIASQDNMGIGVSKAHQNALLKADQLISQL